jgi:hypothetical protein
LASRASALPSASTIVPLYVALKQDVPGMGVKLVTLQVNP